MSAQIDDRKQRRYSEDEVLRQIEQAVLDHRLPPGTKLKEVQLADLFGVKRGTIRKVLTRLAHSRLVEQTPHRGASVAKPSAQEGKDLFAARRVLEAGIVEMLIETIDDAQIARLRELLEREQKAYRNGDSDRALALSVDFHRQLARMAGNSVLEAYLEDIIRRTPLVILTHLGDDDENRCRNQEHVAIVEALIDRDRRKAKRIMQQHLLHIEGKIGGEPETAQTDIASLLGPIGGQSPS